MAEETLLVKLGGSEKLGLIIDKVFEKLLEDPRIRNRFPAIIVPTLKTSMKTHIEAIAQGNSPSSNLETHHSQLAITSAEYDIVVGYYEKAAWELGCMHETAQSLSGLVNSLRPGVIGSS
jgi:truncated hemoglobin YjbI